MATRTSRSEKRKRVHLVFEMLIEGKATVTILTHCMDAWGVSKRTAYDYMQEADDVLKDMLKGKKIAKVNRAVALRETLIEKLIDNKNYPMAFQIMMDKSKLENLYEQPEEERHINPPQIHLHKVATQDEFDKLSVTDNVGS